MKADNFFLSRGLVRTNSVIALTRAVDDSIGRPVMYDTTTPNSTPLMDATPNINTDNLAEFQDLAVRNVSCFPRIMQQHQK